MNQTNDQVTNIPNTSARVNTTINTPVGAPVSGVMSKELETKPSQETQLIQTNGVEIDLPKEVANAGVTHSKENIEIPPDLQKIGVQQAGASMPVVNTQVLPAVVLPITDGEVLTGLHAQIASALLWLAVWCTRRLKKAHLALKNIHGKIVRVKI